MEELNVHTVLENQTIKVPYNSNTTAEDVCIYVCKQLNIGTLTRNLFGLRITGKSIFLMPAATFAESGVNVDFRIRYKIEKVSKLEKIDINTYNYYFHQARNDVLENKIPDIVYERHRRELVGLGITDMYRVMLEKGVSREGVEGDYKKFVPKEVQKRHHLFFIRKPIRDTLCKLEKSGHNASYVKAEYLRQLQILAPEYLSEFYKAVIDQNGTTCNVIIKVSPYDTSEPGLKYCMDSKKEQWNLICSIEELGFISIRSDCTTEISRINGIPFYVKFRTIPVMYSFISLLDGYYRLTCKWTFNLCKDVITPSLQRLYAMKCHGPVGGEFSYSKLEAKRGNRLGCFIIRESESKYNSYYIDVCMREGKPKTFKLEKISNDEFIFNDDLTRYKSIHQLMMAYNDPNGTIFLQECLPPSEYDVSPLLLCRSEKIIGDSLTDSSDVNAFMPKSPMCINCKNLQVYKGQKKEGYGGKTVLFRSMWKVTRGKKIEVAMKMLKDEHSDTHLKEFLTLAGHWAFLQSSAVIRLYGIAFTSNISFVLEYSRLGSLDQYLQKNRGIMKTEDLLEAASNLASALWHLAEHNIMHGKIRCRKLLVNSHDENSFTVKLADPGIFTPYTSSDVHWLPIECFSNFNYAKQSFEADVWAFGTTLWEIFTCGKQPAEQGIEIRGYVSGKRLPKPDNCLDEMYEIMKECWDIDPHKRKKPQAISRDINRILYQVFNSRQKHSYAKIGSKFPSSLSSSTLCSSKTLSTILVDDLICIRDVDTSSESSFLLKGSTMSEEPYDWSHLLSPLNLSTATTSLDSLNSMQSVFELDGNYSVVLQGRIGQGFYGEVFQGTLESVNQESPRKVAVKKLKTTALSSYLQDFEREINIMTALKHPNIVEILGVLREPEISLVMEFVHHGSLQSYLKINKESLEDGQLLKYALDIAKGMDYLGTKNIVHRDLAARNILVVDENHVKISDFGLAQVMGTSDYYILKTPNRELPIKWYAPESLRDGKFSVRSDVWSFGVTMCEMYNYGEEPNLANIDEEIEGQQQQVLLNALEKGARFPCPSDCPTVVYIRIIYPCWEADPHVRPQFAKLVLEIQDLLSQY